KCSKRLTDRCRRRDTWCTAIPQRQKGFPPSPPEARLRNTLCKPNVSNGGRSMSDVLVMTAPSVRSSSVLDHFRCQGMIPDFCVSGALQESKGFFRFGLDAVCFGRTSSGKVSPEVNAALFDAAPQVQ